MSRELTSLFKEEAVVEEQSQLYHLISFLNIPTTPTPTDINVVDSNDDITFAGVTYSKFPCVFNGIEMTGDGAINKASLVVANPDRVFEAYLQQYKGLRGVRVHVKTVFDRFTDTGTSPDPTAAIEDEFIIDSYISNEQTITFQLDPVCDFNVKAPRRRYTNLCYWRFKDSETCMYAGSDTACKKDLASCRLKGNQARYGGFPGIPSQARRISL